MKQNTIDLEQLHAQYSRLKQEYAKAQELANTFKSELEPYEAAMNSITEYTGEYNIQEAVSANIRKALKASGMTQLAFSKKLGLSASTISLKFSNKAAWTLADIQKTAGILRLNPAVLVAGCGFEPQTSGSMFQSPNWESLPPFVRGLFLTA